MASHANEHAYKWANWQLARIEHKQEENISHDPAAMYRFNDVVVVILSGLIRGL